MKAILTETSQRACPLCGDKYRLTEKPHNTRITLFPMILLFYCHKAVFDL